MELCLGRRNCAADCRLVMGLLVDSRLLERGTGMADRHLATAATIQACGTGDYSMVGTSGELSSPFYTNRTDPWIVGDQFVIDPLVVEYVHFAKLMRDSSYESGAGQWSEGWFAGMNGTLTTADGTPKQVFGYFLPTWGLPYVLIPNSTSQDGSSSTADDWGLVTGPLPYQWGGTWFGALQSSQNPELAQAFIAFVALNGDFQTRWATGYYTNEVLRSINPDVPEGLYHPAGDFVSSQVVVAAITDSFDTGSVADFMGGQNTYHVFAESAPLLSARLMTGADDSIQRALNDPLAAYLNDTLTEAEMWQQFIDAVANENPDLIMPEPPVSS